MILLWGAGLLAAAQFAKVSLLLPELSALYGREIAGVSVLVSVLSLTGILFGLMAGAWVARLGPSRVVLAALVMGGVLSAAQAMAQVFPLVLGLRVLEGVSHLALVVAAPTLMIQVSSPRDRPVVMGLWATFFGVSFAGAAVLMPLAENVRLVWAFHGMLMLMLAAVMRPGLPLAVVGVEMAPPGFMQAHRQLYSTPRLVIPALGFVWHTLMFIALLALAPRSLPGWVGPLLALVALAGTFSAGFLARRVAPDRIAVFGFAATILLAVPAFSWLLSDAPTLQAAAALVAFFFIGLVPGASFAAIPHFNEGPEATARAQGGVAQLGNVGTALGTPIYAFFPDGMAAITIVFCLAGIVSLLWSGQRIRAASENA